MKQCAPIPADALDRLPPHAADPWAALRNALAGLGRKIVVLDDDPTGVQTVHDVYVYTRWDRETILEAFRAPEQMFFVLTNSRGLTAAESRAQHTEIAENIAAASKATGKPFLLLSRGDSTLRGHWPMETEVLRETLEARGCPAFDGEVIYPFFPEGGRFTLDDVHYVRQGEQLVPAGQTEFAGDKSLGVTGFGKICVDSADYGDTAVFVTALCGAIAAGKNFLFRCAAALPKVLGGVEDRPLLEREELVDAGNRSGGIILVGSHVNKTSRQLAALQAGGLPMDFITFDQHRVLEAGGLEDELQRVLALCEEKLGAGRSVAVFTRRERLDLDTEDADAQLRISTQISDTLTRVIGDLEVRPSFVVAKGGITSSDVGTKALRVRKARVMGQIRPGIPVWQTGPESKFPGLPYVIFPGNVGAEDDLLRIAKTLIG